jgi:hypothetical protein
VWVYVDHQPLVEYAGEREGQQRHCSTMQMTTCMSNPAPPPPRSSASVAQWVTRPHLAQSTEYGWCLSVRVCRSASSMSGPSPSCCSHPTAAGCCPAGQMGAWWSMQRITAACPSKRSSHHLLPGLLAVPLALLERVTAHLPAARTAAAAAAACARQ